MHEDNTTVGSQPVTEVTDAPARTEAGSVHVLVGRSWTRIVLSGEIDAELGTELNEAGEAADATGLPIEIDAHHVTFMDSSGVAFLARLATRASRPVRVLRAPATVRFLLEVTRIEELLEILDDDPGFELGLDGGPGKRTD